MLISLKKYLFIVYYTLNYKIVQIFRKRYLQHRGLLVGEEGETALYCYSVWMRHIIKSAAATDDTLQPRHIVEIGPGASIGVGITALLLGAETYTAYDAVPLADKKKLLKVLDDVLELIEQRSPIPADDLFPNLKPKLASYDFPSYIYTNEFLEKALCAKRVEEIKHEVRKFINGESCSIKYYAPWYITSNKTEREKPYDFIFSQAVLEHVDDLDKMYNLFGDWLVSGGILSHQVDFRHHKTSFVWNGHWLYSDAEFNYMRGSEDYLINRVPWSGHKFLILENGFKILSESPVMLPSTISLNDVNYSDWALTESDLQTSGIHFVAKKTSDEE